MDFASHVAIFESGVGSYSTLKFFYKIVLWTIRDMEDQEKSNFEPSSLGTFSLFEPTLANFERYWANFKRYWQILSVIGQILSVFGQNLKKHSSHRVMGNNCIVL